MNKYSHLTSDQKDAETAMNRLSISESELRKLIKETTTEEETFKTNTDINTYPGYSYYDSEITRLRSLITKKQLGVDSVTKAHTAKRESQIELLKHNIAKMEKQIETLEEEIKSYRDSSESMTNTIEDNHKQQIEVYLEKMQKIRDVIGKPTSLTYRRKKTRIEELEKIIDKQREDFDIANAYTMAKSKHDAIIRMNKERAKEEEKERIEKARALEAWERTRTAEIEADTLRWATKGLETETAQIYEPEPEFDLTTSVGRNAQKMYNAKKKPSKE